MSALTLIIGNKNYSSWSLRPWIFMKHYQIPFEEKRVALFTDSTNQELAPYQSNYKVPVLQNNNFIVWDSLSILEYVSEKFIEGKGWPQDVKARAFARSVSAEMHSSFSALRNECPMNCRKNFQNYKLSLDAQSDIARIEELWKNCRTQYAKQGEWLFGRYSIADAMFAPVVLRFSGYGIPVGDIGQAYIQTVLKDPLMQSWIADGKAETEVIEMDEVEA